MNIRFEAMGCPCEILLDAAPKTLGTRPLAIALAEARRIEYKYSRYIAGSLIDRINSSAGTPIQVDDETAALLDYAAECHALSDGLFDITTGALRKIWTGFDGRECHVKPDDVAAIRASMGWDKVRWERPWITLPPGVEIDFGGICKEYAADKILDLLLREGVGSALVNLGGDIAARGDHLWRVGIEDVAHPGQIAHTVQLREGGLATSGSTKRFIRINGEIFGHILNPKTGWPVRDAPESVTVTAKNCTEAGFWSTLAMLQGRQAEIFLARQSVAFWCYRSPAPPDER